MLRLKIFQNFNHRDPFDRLFVVQCELEPMHFVSADPVFDQYGIKRIW